MNPEQIIDLDYLESRLKGSVPPAYREYVRTRTPAALAKQGFDPKTLLILNLELEQLEHFGGIDRRFFLNGDGCGNYHFVDLAGDQNMVLLWAHDPPGIEDTCDNLATHLRDSEQDHRIDWPVRSGELWICRTPTYAESILDPITLDEWIKAVQSTEGLSYLGYREGRNPFTGELSRTEVPGHTAVLGHKNCFVSLFHGRAQLRNIPGLQPIATILADRLKAHVLCAG